ncbi:hydrogen peroxide-dependent heme synthase [Aliicoccus persicus]|uniref:Coproheme decarboxylase n=1 Tax=Aliicoccus persicus TaxID=930138 RepID=A0A662Z3W5_9STAP|nr:hydrogen peroxide-dependent heme synthase [Aliicoccus persicus]SEW07177.1 chlorite dismutase [Aliicoccus persicus]
MSEAATTLDGWYSLHLLYNVDWSSLRLVDNHREMVEELQEFLNRLENNHRNQEGSYAFYNMTGQKSDLMLWMLRPTMDELNALELELNKLRISDFLEPAYSYVSVLELGSYLAKDSAEDPYQNPFVRARLFPELPRSQYVCFYPMDKKREGNDNWYSLPMEERRRLMRDHALIGRKYAGKIKQFITGSTGFDAFEWGVTLFSDDILQFKHIVYEMRFDEASARYGVFGDFFVGVKLEVSDLDSFFDVQG